MDTHAHLWDGHPEKVRTFRDEAKGTLKFALDCPFCEEGMERVANPRGREEGFLVEFRREIALMAFDLLLYHFQASHAELVGLPPIPEESTAGGVP
ncbi:MAG: hypothetical protein HW391_1089 [Chloroflexi bacterium]|nr:hypothetical protein [Chloroflexota bacterium]